MTTHTLTGTQRTILTAAAQHPERAVIMPDRLRGGAVARVVDPLLAKGLVETVPHRPGLPAYKTEADGTRLVLLVTDAGLRAIGIEPEEVGRTKPARSRHGSGRPEATDAALGGAAPARSPRSGTKQALLITMLRRPEGTTIPEVVDATGWQAHTVRGAMAGALKKRLGLTITSETVEGRGRVYRIPG